MIPKLRIIRPSSREATDLLSERLVTLRQLGFIVLYEDLPKDPNWAYTAATAADRCLALTTALAEVDSDVIVCARGGYGASDLLPLLPWDTLKNQRPKMIVGFSDVSALHGAFYARLGWPGLHGPMPATVLWGKDDVTSDTQALLLNLRQWVDGKSMTGSLPISPVAHAPHGPIQGRLFGGCFTVLTNLIGTPFFPGSLADHILFLEDTDEHPGRLTRAFNQWLQAGLLTGVRALVIGHLRNLGPNIPDSAAFMLAQFASRSNLPVFHSPNFGHTSPNFPLAIGANASIHAGRLSWHLDQASRRPSSNQDPKT